MASYEVCIAAAGFCFMCIVWACVKNKVIKWVAKACVCSTLILIMNVLVPQYAVAFNAYTIGFSALLGMPGVMTLYVVKMIL